MSTRDFEIFQRVVMTGSMSEAGRELDISPATVSRQIGALEKRLGTRLFYRPAGRLELTASGRAFYERVVANEWDI